MLKLQTANALPENKRQPPSGGCVLKQVIKKLNTTKRQAPAAFGRLCVETSAIRVRAKLAGPAAFGRLCVETKTTIGRSDFVDPAAFGRLCVETQSRFLKA